MKKIFFTKTAPGIWRARIGKPATVTPLSIVGVKPRIDAIARLGEKKFPLPKDRIEFEKAGLRLVIRVPLDADEKIFGMGLQFIAMNHRGRTRYLRVNSDPIQDTGETHAPVPFYVSSRGYGVLVNTAKIVSIYCASTGRKTRTPASYAHKSRLDNDWEPTPPTDYTEIVLEGDGAELYVFGGERPLEVVQRYNLFCGGGILPPRWGLGFWHRVDMHFNHKQVLADALQFRKKDFPCDVIGLEPGWQTKCYPSTHAWDKKRFPNPAKFVAQMARHGFHVNLWEQGFISPVSKIHKAMEKLAGSHTVWGGLAPDFLLPKARELWKKLHDANHLRAGVAGYKTDECDGSELTTYSWMFPGHATFPSGLTGEEMRQVFGLLLQKMGDEMFRRRNRRTYGLVRASTTGSTPLPYVLYSDLYDHRQFVRALCNSSFSGLLWCPEVRGCDTGEDFVRRMQTVCFSPLMMLNAWNCPTRPWAFPEVESIVRKYMKLRMRLIPYLYSAFSRYYFEGIPPFRAFPLETDGEVIDDQYFAGDSLLVAPMFAGDKSREVRLPRGTWYDFDTGERFEGNRTVRVFHGLDRIPVFVREGGILPLAKPTDCVPAAGKPMDLEIRFYGTEPGTYRFDLFDDDGETFDYEKGRFRRRKLEVSVSPFGTKIGTVEEPEKKWKSAYGKTKWKFM